jgi:hypothetical protein
MHFRSETPKARVGPLRPALWCDGSVPGGCSSVPHGRRVASLQGSRRTPVLGDLDYIMTGVCIFEVDCDM